MNVCIPQIQAEDIGSHAEEEELITWSPPHPGQYILKPFCIRIRLLLLRCGSLPSTPLVWASLVTGATGCGVTFPQKSSVLNKSPNIAGDFVSFSACGQKEVLLPCKKQEGEGSGHTMVLWQRANLPLPLLDLALF